MSRDEALLLAAVAGAPEVGIFVLGPAGEVRTWNTAAATLTGYDAADVVGRSLEVLDPPDTPPEDGMQFRLAVAVADGCFEHDGWWVRKDGARFWANIVVTAVRGEGGRLEGFGVVVRDETERRRGVDALRESEERFALLVRNVADYAIFLLAPDGTVASWNVGAERLKGYRADEIVGRHFSAFYSEADRRAGVPAGGLEEAKERGRWESEGWRIRKDGTRFWANVVITCLRGQHGRHIGFAKVTRDLTDRKRNEDALRGILDREREAAVRLHEIDRAKTDLLASVAHDLRSPVAVIRTVLHLVDDEWETSSDAERHSLIVRARRRADQLANFVLGVFDIARIDAGELALELAVVDLGAVASDVVADAAVNAPTRRIEVEVEGSPQAAGDPQRAWQVLANLVSNALRYSDDTQPVLITVRELDGEVVVAVTDHGPGVPEDERDRLFERFTRLSSGRNVPGSGLGLYIARTLADAQGGRVWLERSDAGGSTFAFALGAAAA